MVLTADAGNLGEFGYSTTLIFSTCAAPVTICAVQMLLSTVRVLDREVDYLRIGINGPILINF